MFLLLPTTTSALPCSSDLGCSLNGVCVNGTCACFAPWIDATTEACSVLDIEPHPDDYVPAYGGPRTSTVYHKQNLTSWGGNMLLGKDKRWHLYVSTMDGGSGLEHWASKSRIDHAVAKDPMDVFIKADTALPK
jgi:EGF-like domain.